VPLGYCKARDWAAHMATRRTGYCEHHHVEYSAVRGRWKSAVNNFRRGASRRDPGTWQEYLAMHAHFTDRDHPTEPSHDPELNPATEGPAVPIPETTSRRLITLAEGLDYHLRQFHDRALNLNQSPFTREWAVEVEDRVEAMKCAAAALRAVAKGEEPSGPWPREKP